MTIRHVMPWRADHPMAITILIAPARRLAKLIHPDGITDYDNAKHFVPEAVQIDGFDDIPAMLAELATLTEACVIRAALKPGFAGHPTVLRRIHDQPGEPAPFREVPRSWLMVDLEPTAPPWLDPTDAELVGGYLRRQLPRCFQAARCCVQLSGGAGIRAGARAHLWFVLSRPLDKAGLDQLLGAVPGVDRSVHGAAQIHYTASPIFAGVDDPVHERIAVLPGLEVVGVPNLPPPRQQRQPLPCEARPHTAPVRGVSFKPTRAEAYANTCIMALAEAPVGQGRTTAIRVACRLLGLAKAGLLDPVRVAALIKGAMLSRGWDPDETRRGDTIADVNRLLDWAWDRCEPEGLP